MAEQELEGMLAPYGTVISTRILRDNNHQPRGVGFARMDSKDKCDMIIQAFNGKVILGSKEPLLVKFADGGNKKKSGQQNRTGGGGGGWRDNSNDLHGSGIMGHHHHFHSNHDQSSGLSLPGQNGLQSTLGLNHPAAASAAAAMAAAAAYGQRGYSMATGQIQATASYNPATGFQTRQAYSTGPQTQGASGFPNPGGYQQATGRAYQTAASPHLHQGGTATASYNPAALQATNHQWMHPAAAAAAATQYHLVTQSPSGHMQQQMIPSQTLQALHLSALMPQISAQMSQLSLSGAPSVRGDSRLL